MSSYKPPAACCSTAAIIGTPYDPKGTFIDVDGTKTYHAGPANARKAIFMIYDVFGYSGQILEGADKLAEEYKIFMPDFFDGNPAPLDWMPLDGPVDMQKLDAFCEGPGETQKTMKRITELKENFQQMHPEIESWGLVGYCWGGYIVPFAVGQGSPFSACVQCHPGWPGADIAAKVSAPLLSLNSKDEPESEYKDFKPALKVAHHFETFPEMVHGWLSARGDLAKGKVRRDFDRGYQMMLEWFDRYL